MPDFNKDVFDRVEKEERGHIKMVDQWYKKYIEK